MSDVPATTASYAQMRIARNSLKRSFLELARVSRALDHEHLIEHAALCRSIERQMYALREALGRIDCSLKP